MRSSNLLIAVLATVLLLGNAPLGGQELTAKKLEEMVRQLSADQFLARETAMQALLKAGVPAIESVDKHLNRQDPEAAARAITVLHEVAISGDADQEVAATQLLTELSTGDSPAAKQARVEIAWIARQRKKRALDRLQRAGMVAKTSPQLDGTLVVYGVEFNERWRGSLQDLSQLQWLRDVQQVEITYAEATNDWMKYVAGLPDLTTLSIKRTKIDDDGLKLLKPQTQPLQYLEFKYMNVTDAIHDHLALMVSLERIKLYGTKFTEEAAESLQGKLRLATVDRRDGAFLGVSCQSHPLGCEITLVSEGTAADKCGIINGDVVVEYDGHSVADFERLTKWISHNKVGDEVKILYARQVDVFNFELGKIAGKKSGLEVKPHKLGIQVAKVSDSSPLLTLVRERDVVFRLNDTRVKTVKELDDAMAALKPNEEATIYVARGGQLFERTAKLGEWD